MAVITLSPQERQALQDAIKRARDGQVLRRAQALVWLDDGEKVATVAQRLRVSRQTIYTWVRNFQQRQAATLTERLRDAPRSGRPASKRSAVQALLSDTPAPVDNLDALPFRAPEMRRRLGQQGVQLCTRTIRRALRALGYRYKRPRYVLARRSSTWRQAKGG